MIPIWRTILQLGLLCLFCIHIQAKRGPDPKFYTGYRCNSTTECPKDAGFCNEHQQCECSIHEQPQEHAGKIICGQLQCNREYDCPNLYGNNTKCFRYIEDGAYSGICTCKGGLEYSHTDRECSIDRSKIGQKCSSDQNCTLEFTNYNHGVRAGGTICDQETGKCICGLGEKPYSDWFCEVISCTADSDCQKSDPYMTCLTSYKSNLGICRCRQNYEPDYYDSKNFSSKQYYRATKCVALLPGMECTKSYNCANGMSCVFGKCLKNSSNILFSSRSILILFVMLTICFSAQ